MSEIYHKDIACLSHLSLISLSDTEVESFTIQLNTIVDYVGKIKSVDTSGIKSDCTSSVTTSKIYVDSMNFLLKNHNETSDILSGSPCDAKGNLILPQILRETSYNESK